MKLRGFLPLIAALGVQSKIDLHLFESTDQQRQQSSQRQLVSFESLAGYQPKSLITDEAAIDLDLKTLVEIIDTKSFRRALPVYVQGGHSDSYAVLQVQTKNSAVIDAGQQLLGLNADGTIVHGPARTSVTTFPGSISGSGKGALLSVNYDINSVQSSYVGCQVGALGMLGGALTSGCKLELWYSVFVKSNKTAISLTSLCMHKLVSSQKVLRLREASQSPAKLRRLPITLTT